MRITNVYYQLNQNEIKNQYKLNYKKNLLSFLIPSLEVKMISSGRQNELYQTNQIR